MSATITAHVSCNGYLLFVPIFTGALSLRESAVTTAFFLGFFGFFASRLPCLFSCLDICLPPNFRGLRTGPAAFEILRSSNRVPADDDPIDQIRHGLMLFRFACARDGILMGRRGVAKKAKNSALGEKATIIHGKQECLADGQRRLACWFACLGHRIFPFCIVNQPGEVQNHRYFWQEMYYAGLIQSSIGASFRSWIAKRLDSQ
ncbi:hypothetical protein HAT86_14805 [Roseovarius gahaiensis]|uniref:Uncharacterized protein n=1 Tax=Roseovarius gahaiensis TaxID=2716691 RepID=A0A967EH30_9RHOB|nr:hypothetical protein [Roseovarius gahaiensis]